MHKNLVHKNMVKMNNISSSVGGGQMGNWKGCKVDKGKGPTCA